MTLNSLIRKATTNIIPLAIRTLGSPRSFRSAISTVQKGRLIGELNREILSPILRFSTATAKNETAGDSLIRILDSEIELAKSEETSDQNLLENKPKGFPFEIEDTPGERTIFLKRQYQDETIKVEVDMPINEEGEEEGDKKGNEDETDRSHIALVVHVSKGDSLCLEFIVTALPDEIIIDNFAIKKPEAAEDQVAYEGPDYNDLDENLQKGLVKYLEVRGIKPSITNFLIEYMADKDSREYLQWLGNLKNFFEK